MLPPGLRQHGHHLDPNFQQSSPRALQARDQQLRGHSAHLKGVEVYGYGMLSLGPNAGPRSEKVQAPLSKGLYDFFSMVNSVTDNRLRAARFRNRRQSGTQFSYRVCAPFHAMNVFVSHPQPAFVHHLAVSALAQIAVWIHTRMRSIVNPPLGNGHLWIGRRCCDRGTDEVNALQPQRREIPDCIAVSGQRICVHLVGN